MSRYVVADLFLPSIGAGVEGGRAYVMLEEPARVGTQQSLRHRHRHHQTAVAWPSLPATPGVDAVDEIHDALATVWPGTRVGEPRAEFDGIDLLWGQPRPPTDVQRPQRVVDDDCSCRPQQRGGLSGCRLRSAGVDRPGHRRGEPENGAATTVVQNSITAESHRPIGAGATGGDDLHAAGAVSPARRRPTGCRWMSTTVPGRPAGARR